MTYKIIVHSQQDVQSSRLFKDTDKICIYFYCIYTVCSYTTAVDQQHASNRTKTLKYFTQTSIALHLTCSRQSQQREQAAHRQQRLHFGSQGPSPHLPRLYIPLRLKVRGHAGGGDAQLLHPYQPLCVRAAACPNHER